MDALLFLPSVAATSPIDPEDAWTSFRPTHNADPGEVNAVLAAVAGDFHWADRVVDRQHGNAGGVTSDY